jgi:hypothetical protein
MTKDQDFLSPYIARHDQARLLYQANPTPARKALLHRYAAELSSARAHNDMYQMHTQLFLKVLTA